MPTLFGYSVDDEDGRLVISVHGRLAEEGLRRIHDQIDAGAALPLPALLAPLRPLRGLLSASVSLGQGGPIGPSLDDTEDMLSQAVSQTLTDFRQHLDEFRTSVQQLQAEREEPAARAREKPSPAKPG
jgi:hypothetical protein